jgi:hypothetical protein
MDNENSLVICEHYKKCIQINPCPYKYPQIYKHIHSSISFNNWSGGNYINTNFSCHGSKNMFYYKMKILNPKEEE